MTQMLFDEAGDEVVAVIVALLHAQAQWLARFAAGSIEEFRVQGFMQERVGRAVDA